MTLNRRKFIQNLGLTGVGLGLTLNRTNANPLRPVRDLSEVRLTGSVKSEGKGIAGVAITDGLNVVTTNINGNYALKSNASAEFVYISTPRG